MRGWSWASRAAFVSWGTLSRLTNSTGSPALAAHAAAGMAKSGSSAETTRTRSLLLPRAAVWKASSARASANGSRPAMSVVRRPGGRATSPTRTTWAPPAALAPSGCRAASASRRGRRQVGPVGEQDGGAHRRRGEDGARRCRRASRARRSARRRWGGSRAWWRGIRPARRRPHWRSDRRRRCASCSWSRRPGSRGRGWPRAPSSWRRGRAARRWRWSCSAGCCARTPSRRARRAGRRGRRRGGASGAQRYERRATAARVTPPSPSAGRRVCITSRAVG